MSGYFVNLQRALYLLICGHVGIKGELPGSFETTTGYLTRVSYLHSFSFNFVTDDLTERVLESLPEADVQLVYE